MWRASSPPICSTPLHEVVLFEADSRLGGHCNTVTVDDPLAGSLGVDTGFIVHNDRNYPNLVRLFAELGITTVDTEMSFAVTDRATGFTYRATNLDTLLARRRNARDPRLWRMLADNRPLLPGGTPAPGPAAERRRRHHHRGVPPRRPVTVPAFIDLHLIPLGAAVWSSDPSTFDEFPARSLLRFLDNHGLLSVGDRPQWRAIVGGSRTYVDAIAAGLRGTVRPATPVHSIDRSAGTGVTVRSGRRPGAVRPCHPRGAQRPRRSPCWPTRRRSRRRCSRRSGISRTGRPSTPISRCSPPEPRAWAAWNYDRLQPPPTTGGDDPAGNRADRHV